jgi:hypothetical protein
MLHQELIPQASHDSPRSDTVIVVSEPMPANPTEPLLPAETTPKANFATRWIKPAMASYVVATGMNIAMPHFFGQTLGRIPGVAAWTAKAMKTVFENVPKPVLDMLMTAGNFATYKSVKGFFVAEDTTPISWMTQAGNIVIFWGSSALVGYATRLVCVASGHIPEEGMMMPVAPMIPDEYLPFIPADLTPLLPNLFLWNQNVSALTLAAQTIVTPVVENRLKAIAGKTAEVLSPYIKQCLFAMKPVAEAPVSTPVDTNTDTSTTAYTALPSLSST